MQELWVWRRNGGCSSSTSGLAGTLVGVWKVDIAVVIMYVVAIGICWIPKVYALIFHEEHLYDFPIRIKF